MSYCGDYKPGDTIYGKFTMFRPSTGAPYTLAGTPALSVYKDGSTTQSTSGITLTVDFDSVTGLNHFAIDTSADGAFYAAGSSFDIVITTGTVDGISAVGTKVASFSLARGKKFSPPVMFATVEKDSVTARVPFRVYDQWGNPATGLTFLAADIQVSENGGAAAASGGTASEVDAGDIPGLYYYTPSGSETDNEVIYNVHINKSGYVSGGAVYEVVPAIGVTNNAIDSHLVSVATNASGFFNNFRKNTAFSWPFKMVDETDKYTVETGVTVSCTRSLDGGAFAACTNSPTEIGSGWYYINFSAADANGEVMVFKATAPGCAVTEIIFGFNPT